MPIDPPYPECEAGKPPRMECPQHDRLPSRTTIRHQTAMIEPPIESDWTALNTRQTVTEIFVNMPENFVLPNATNAWGSITLFSRNVNTSGRLDFFKVIIGTMSETDWTIPYVPGVDPDDAPFHPFLARYGPPHCNWTEQHETVDDAYPPTVIIENAFDLAGKVLAVLVQWFGESDNEGVFDFGCDDPGQVRVSLTYEIGTSEVTTEDLPLKRWEENVNSNVVYTPVVPRRDHPEFGSAPRMIGFTEDRATDTFIPGRRPIPKGFFEPFSVHETRMVEEAPAASNAVGYIVQSLWTPLDPTNEAGESVIPINNLVALPAPSNIRGSITVKVRGVDTTVASNHFFVRFGAADAERPYTILSGDPDNPHYPFFHLFTPRCAEQEENLDSAFPPWAIAEHAVQPDANEDRWNIAVFLLWQGPGGTFGECPPNTAMAQVELRYEVFVGEETATEVCKHSYASMVVGPDGMWRGFFCSQPDYVEVQKYQQNHYAHPFINRGMADDPVEPEEGHRDYSVAQAGIPVGMWGFIGGFHAPRWTELLYYSRRQLCDIQV